MKIYYGGHSSFMIENGGFTVLIDPFMLSEDMKKASPSIIALTHGHGDHIGNAAEISIKKKAPILAVFELANYFAEKGCETIDGHIGGKIKFDFGYVKFVNSLHGNSSPEGRYTGNPCGFIVDMNGIRVYHAGDTGLFGDMALIAEQTPVDVFLCPIGDKYTMGPEDALKAVSLVRPKVVVPMHFNTFELIAQDAGDFKKKVEGLGIGVTAVVMSKGDVLNYPM